MDTSTLLQWHYMIFLLPLGVAALFLLLSSLRIGRRHGGRHGHRAHAPGGRGHARAHGASHSTHARSHTPPAGRAGGHGKGGRSAADAPVNTAVSPVSTLLGWLGIGRARQPMELEIFWVLWGFCGIFANQWLVNAPNPSPFQMLPSLGIALGGSVFGTRAFAGILSRVLPEDETDIVSRDELFGLTGRITFPVSEESGRIHIYDDFGTLHDEVCRISSDQPPISKGRRAMVVDMDAKGNLVVEEVPDTVR